MTDKKTSSRYCRTIMSNNSTHNMFVTMGVSNHCADEREINDYYATDPIALEKLLEVEEFDNYVWECVCGEGHLSKVLKGRGYDVYSTDLIDRGFGETLDFLQCKTMFDGDIMTNSPYKYAKEFVEHALELVTSGHRVAMFLKLTFLEGKERRKLFDTHPPSIVYVSTSRISCCKNGDFSEQRRKNSSAQAYGWFIWEKPQAEQTIIKWFN